jgi:hypothetical protein
MFLCGKKFAQQDIKLNLDCRGRSDSCVSFQDFTGKETYLQLRSVHLLNSSSASRLFIHSFSFPQACPFPSDASQLLLSGLGCALATVCSRKCVLTVFNLVTGFTSIIDCRTLFPMWPLVSNPSPGHTVALLCPSFLSLRLHPGNVSWTSVSNLWSLLPHLATLHSCSWSLGRSSTRPARSSPDLGSRRIGSWSLYLERCIPPLSPSAKLCQNTLDCLPTCLRSQPPTTFFHGTFR